MQASKIDLELADELTMFYHDPLGFVLFAYPWDTDPSLQVVELPAPWNLIYGSKYGPDAWACEMLDEIGRLSAQNAFDGQNPVDPIRMATSSGHGIGKSAMTGWIVDWIMSTRPFAQGTITANTGPQLETKTWAQIAKWTKLCITSHWFEINTGRGSMRMYHKDYPESWFCSAQTCREENSESFAGQHAANSTSFYIFDEASAVPDVIWEVAEGGLTDGEPMMFAFGNPTRNTGRFFECFNKLRHRWITRKIDSRTVAITNKKLLKQWVDDEGEDSDFVKVRVRGEFPNASSLQFIPLDIVRDAAVRPVALDKRSVALVGVDVARFGDDQSVIRTRIGRDARTHEPKRYRGLDTMQLAARVAEHVNMLRQMYRVVIFVDGGGVGGGVVDRLRQMNFEVIEVQFGGKASDTRKYANKRAEMWGRLKDWLPTGCIDNDDQLITDLTSVEYAFTLADQIQLEKKERMKERGLASPDDADALALTFAEPVIEIPEAHNAPEARSGSAERRAYDPFKRFKGT